VIQIVPFSAEYTQRVASLILPIQQHEFAIPITLAAQPDLNDIPGFYQQGAGNFWLALAGDSVVGSVALLDIGNQQAALRKMFVAQAYRGPGYAVAQKLLCTLLESCRSKGVTEIYLGTTAQFLAAHRFYEKHRFQEIARDALPARFPVMAVDSKFYWRSLLSEAMTN
jgi:N-acetylglutamate synthase-like GNAT family acetyltransferase